MAAAATASRIDRYRYGLNPNPSTMAIIPTTPTPPGYHRGTGSAPHHGDNDQGRQEHQYADGQVRLLRYAHRVNARGRRGLQPDVGHRRRRRGRSRYHRPGLHLEHVAVGATGQGQGPAAFDVLRPSLGRVCRRLPLGITASAPGRYSRRDPDLPAAAGGNEVEGDESIALYQPLSHRRPFPLPLVVR